MDPCFIEVPDKLFALAESLSIEGSYTLEKLDFGADSYVFLEPLKYKLSISNTGGALLISGIVKGGAQTVCVRCLESARYELEGEIEAYFLIPGSELELSREEREEYDTLREDRLIDVAALIQAALALELPYTPLCDDACKGICAGCGANLNKEPCLCETREGKNNVQNPFSVLCGVDFDTL